MTQHRPTARTRAIARAMAKVTATRHQDSSSSQALRLLLLLICHRCPTAHLLLSHPSCHCCCEHKAAAVARWAWQWQESNGAAEQQGWGCGLWVVDLCVYIPYHTFLVWGTVLAIPDTKIFVGGIFVSAPIRILSQIWQHF